MLKWATLLGLLTCDVKKRHERLILYKNTPEEYPKYDNYDAINVNSNRNSVIRLMMGFITFLDKYNPDSLKF